MFGENKYVVRGDGNEVDNPKLLLFVISSVNRKRYKRHPILTFINFLGNVKYFPQAGIKLATTEYSF